MGIIDKIFQKLVREKAPLELREKILSPEKTPQAPRGRFWKPFKIAVPALLVVLLIAGGVYYQFFTVHKFASAFELTAEDSDAAGISPDSVFILKSSKSLTTSQVKKIINIEPAVDFEVTGLGGNRFQIKPLLRLSGNTIYKIIINEGAAERDYSWAFQVRAPFAALSTFPRHQGAGVPLNSSIEIIFNRDNLENPEGYFEISPKVAGRFEIHGDTLVFLPSQPLKEKTVYTVSIRKGLKAVGAEQPLAEDIVFAFETSQGTYRPNNYFNFNQSIFYFPPDQVPALDLYEYGVNFSGAKATIYSFGSKDSFVQNYYDSREWDLGWAYFYRQSAGLIDTGGLTKITDFSPQIAKFDYKTFFTLPDKLPAGYYLLDMKAGGLSRQAWILVNDVSHYFSLTDKNGFVWAHEYSQKKILEGAAVSYFDAEGVSHELGKTDASGLVEFEVPEVLRPQNSNNPDYGKPKFLEIAPPGYPSMLALVSAGWWYYYSGSNSTSEFWEYLSTDRFTYKLSDTVKFWGVVKGKSQDYKNQKVTLELREGYYYYEFYPRPGFGSEDRPLAVAETIISPFNTISGEISYEGLKPGTYQILAKINDQIVSQVNVEVLAYVKPLYRVNVTPSRSAVFAGENVDFNVKAEFYDGTSVGALKLKYDGYYGSRRITGQLELDSRGQGKVSVTPEFQNSDYYPLGLYLNFSPALAEEGDITSEISASVSVFGPDVYLQASQEYNNNNNFTVTAKANYIVLERGLDTREGGFGYWDYIGHPASGTALRAEVEKTEHLKIEDGTYYDPINKTNNPKYRYEEKKSVVTTLAGTANSNGEWVFSLNLPKAERAYYTVKITGADAKNRGFKTMVYPYYNKRYGNIYYSGAGSPEAERVVLGLNFKGGDQEYNKTFSIGDKIELEAEALEGEEYLNGQTLFYRYSREGIGRLEVVKGKELSEIFQSPWRPAVSYRAVVFGPYGFVESNTLMAVYKQQDAELNINIKPDKQAYRPGEQAQVEVEVKDKDGKISQGEVNLSVVDEAVFDVLPYYWQQNILQSLYQIDYSQPNSGASDFTPKAGLNSAEGGAEGGGCFLAGTGILLPGGRYKAIEDIKVGDIVLTRSDENDGKTLASVIVQGISKHVVGDYLVINNSLKVTAEHKLYVNNAWKEAGLIKLGDRLAGENGGKVVVKRIEKVLAPETMVYNFNVGKYHTYFAGGVFAHNAEKGGGYRSEFLDTAFFESRELTGGKASFEVKLPDNITSWRATASAFDGSKVFAGQTAGFLAATLPFFTDAVISENYLAGDKPTVAARAFGNNFSPNSDTTFIMDIDGMDFHETKTARGGSTDFELPVLSNPGNYELKLKAKQGSMEDGVLRKFTVVESYFETAQSNTYHISSGQTGITSEAKGYTRVAFSDSGKARFYNELVWNKYQRGKRADQVTVSFLAQKILEDYFGEEESSGQLDLGAYHIPGGGIGLFTYGDSDLELSAKLADLAPDYVYQSQLIRYFRDTMRDEKADIHRISRSLYGLAALGQPVLAKLQIIKDEPDLEFSDRLYIALGLARLGDKETARAYYNEHIRGELRFEGGQAWLDKQQDRTVRAKLTSLTGSLAAALGEDQDTLAIWEYVKGHYPTEDLDILERIMIIRDEIGSLASDEVSFIYELGGKKTEVILENGRSKSLLLSSQEMSSIAFSNVKGDLTAVIMLEQSQNPDELNKNPELNIKRSFWVNGKQVSEIREGETVVVRLEYQIAKSAIDGGYQVVDYLPSGLRPLTNLWQRGLSYSYAKCSQKGEPLSVEGNKVYFSAYHSSDYPAQCGTYTVEYYARAAAKGEFNVNPALIQSLKNYGSLNMSDSQKLYILSQ